MLKITLTRKDADLKKILKLQVQNLEANVPDEIKEEQGFVTAVHDLETLQKMAETSAHVVIKDGAKIAGYALAMTRQFSKSVPLLVATFEFQDQLVYKGKTLAEHDYIVMGQVCVAEGYRGQKLVDRMYKYFRGCYSIHYPFLVTAVSPNNPRSIRVHERCGFEVAGTFNAPTGHEWVIVVWDWRK
jgi:L-amino acid N-acyltransferase YncA